MDGVGEFNKLGKYLKDPQSILAYVITGIGLIILGMESFGDFKLEIWGFAFLGLGFFLLAISFQSIKIREDYSCIGNAFKDIQKNYSKQLKDINSGYESQIDNITKTNNQLLQTVNNQHSNQYDQMHYNYSKQSENIRTSTNFVDTHNNQNLSNNSNEDEYMSQR